MADSPIPLTRWFTAIWLMLWRPTITTAELVSNLGITRIMTVRTMANRIRAAMAAENAGDLLAELDTYYAKFQAASPESSARENSDLRGDDAFGPLITRLEALPYVEDDYTKRFRFDSYTNPKLKELRERYRLDEVVAPGRDEFDRQVLLLDWVHHQFKKFGSPSSDAKGALEILQAIGEGHRFHCAHYAQVFVSAAASLGWIDRELALRRHQDSPAGGSTEHSTTEIWSNQHAKGVMLDPTANMHIEKNGVPLNAFEIRQEWFYRDPTRSGTAFFCKNPIFKR